jgi:hypothetical protein
MSSPDIHDQAPGGVTPRIQPVNHPGCASPWLRATPCLPHQRTDRQAQGNVVRGVLFVTAGMLAAMLMATAVWLLITFSQSSLGAPPLHVPSICRVPAVRDALWVSPTVVCTQCGMVLSAGCDVGGQEPAILCPPAAGGLWFVVTSQRAASAVRSCSEAAQVVRRWCPGSAIGICHLPDPGRCRTGWLHD